ncbi:pterin-4-alpha-carbinolamine dehydratase, partial [Plakobranchus ocellatus]
TLKVGCKAFLRVGLKQQVNGEYCLEVKSSRLEHNNHPVSAENAIKYPENRRVSMNDKIKDLVTKPNMRSKDVLEIIKNEQDKSLSSKDLYNLKRKLQSEDNPSITSFPSKPSPVQKQKVMKLEERLVLLEPLLHKGWSVCSDKDAIQKEFIFSNFNEAFRFITGIGLESNRMGHYPEWHNYNSKVGIILQTPSVAGITAKDITLAHYIESLAM